jgi:hypothetical protein
MISLFQQKMAKAASSPRKRSSIHGWNPSAVSIRSAASQHPATKWFKTTPASKHDVIVSGAAAGILTLREPDKIKALAMLTPSQAFPTKYLGQGSHDLNQTVGIYVERNDLTRNIISIMAKATAIEFGFEFFDEDLNAGLHNLADLTAPDLTFAEMPDGLDSTDDATTPVLVLLPTACPIGYGRTAPSGKLSDDETKVALQGCHDGVFAWSNSLDYLCTKHQGQSLHMKIADPDQFIDTYIINEKRANWKQNLTSNIWTVTSTMDIDDEEYITLKEDIQRHAFDQLERYISTNDAARTAFERSTAGTHGSTSTTDMSTAIASAFSAVGSAAGSTTAPDPSTKKFNLAALKLLTIYKDANDNWAIPTKLHTRFESLAKHGVKLGVPMHMHKGMLIFMNNLQENNRDYGTTTATVQKYNRPFWTHLACTAWQTTPIRHGADLTDGTTWSPFNLAPQDPSNVAHRLDAWQIVQEDQEEKAGWSKTDRTKSSTAMTHNFDVNTYQDLIEMIANTSTFLQYITSDDEGKTTQAETPWFSQQTENLLKVICHHEGKTWRTLLDQNYPWAWFRMGVRFVNIFSMLADLAMYPTANFKAQTDIPPINEAKLTRIEHTFLTLANDISTALDNGDCGTFATETPPPIWKEVCTERYSLYQRQRQLEFAFQNNGNGNGNNNNANGNGNPNGNGHPNGGNPNGKKPNGRDRQPDPKRQPRGGGTKGIFTKPVNDKGYGLDDNTPIPKFTFRGEERELCIRFATRDSQGCPFGGKCSKFHLTEKIWSEQPEAKKQEVSNLVAKTKNLIFADGFEPSGKPGNRQAANKKKANTNQQPDCVASGTCNVDNTTDASVPEKTKG